jgi:hypothetical protein
MKPSMKPVLAGVVVAVLAVIAATVWVGARVREDTVVPSPYAEGQKHTGRSDAEVAAAAPAGHGPDHGGHGHGDAAPGPVLTLSPRPLRTMRDLDVEVRWPGPAAEVSVSFAMDGMAMGDDTVRLARASDGVYRGKAVLVRCPSGRRDWVATVRVQGPGLVERQVPFQVEE